ncbi:uncharacterized protein LOC106176286 [Lingula anatina]|uniref:Uncharacterized protein LOC106176286 n=1 Tax=Lingula anatina TaxID=7574 RepID=A0A1S3JVE3_LINAN|nr:uncharacterized protein LOC106176286 [Lingula anatina]|eukprot:XP_013414059.1 uncharacterized protein LOC106176286 [Lingula anatina]
MEWIDGAHSEVFGGSDGVVQVKYHGVWGTVGRTGWSDAAAAVVCSRLGYRTGIGFPRPVYRSWKSWDPSLVQWYEGVQCDGNETSLEACAHSGTCHYANHLWDVSVSCFDTWEGLTVRFAAVFSFFSNILGTLVVEHQGSNGFVCTDGFDDTEASIICRANGYKSGRSVYHHSLIDYFRGPAWISQLNCSGSEGSLTDCPYVVNDENCYSGSWLRRAAVLCLETIDPQESIHYRLEEGTMFSGKVMVGVNGLWKPVSERDFATTESTVFCRQMGFDYGVRYTYGDAGCIDSNSRWDMWLTVDECNPDYHTTLEECTIEGRYWQGSIRCRPPRVLCYFEAGDVCTGGASHPDVIEHKWGQIRSPRRPAVTNSDYDVQCWWLLQVPRQYVLNVEIFVKMDATNLTLYDGSSVNSNVLLFLSGSGESEQTLQATGHQLLIHYDQASYTDYFILGYEAVCNSILGVPAWRNTDNVTSLYGKNVTLLFTGSDWNATCENFSSECLSGIQACQLSCDANTYCWTLYYDIHNGSCYIGVRSYQYGKTVDLTDVHLLQYEIDCTVNGSWSAWSSWSHMPVTCGSGVISRTRTCTDPSPHFGGSDCEGNSTEETLAYSQNCPVPCSAPNSTNDSFLIPISNRSYYLWNEQLDVFCVPGYSSLSGQTEYTITCGYNGTWDMENVTCVLKSSIIDSETVNYNHSETSMVVTSVSLTGMEYNDSAATISYSSLVDSVLFNVSQEYSQSAEQTLLFPSASVLIPSNENNATDLSEGISTISFDGTSPPSSDLETDFISTSIDSIFISNLSTSLDTLQPEEVSDMASTYVQSSQSNNSNVSEAFQSTRGQFSDLMNMASSESISFLSALTPFPSLFRSTQEETVTNIPSVPSSVSESYSPTIFAAVHDFSSSIESFSYFSTDIGFVSPDISFVLPPTSGFSSDISSVVSSGSVAEMSSMFSYPQLFSSLLESAASLPSSENVSSLFPTSLKL